MGVLFGTTDSTSWNLNFLGYSLESPEPKTNTVSIPLRDGVIDMTEALGGYVRYENRQLVMRFELRDDRWNWPSKWTTIRSAIHGKVLDVKLPDDTSYFWHGRCTVSAWTDNGSTGTLEISLDANPFKHASTSTTMGPYTVSGSARTVNISVATDRAFLAFEVTGSVTMTYDGDTYNFGTGIYADSNILYTIVVGGQTYVLGNMNQVPGLTLPNGTTTVTLNGNGTIKIYVVGGSL